MAQITITLTPEAKEALLKLAEREYRDPRYQAGLLVQKELERLGYLSTRPAIIEVRPLEVAR
jgi:predicted transcriptional regulator